MIIFDENVEEYWIKLIMNQGYEYISIRHSFSGITDTEVINIVKEHKGLLITEDKDFGELVFAHGITNVAILFLRYDQPQYDQILEHVLRCIDEFTKNPRSVFITITKNKIRYRNI
jgi:predicted nuclease of predicted toxin-antitoxin system